MGSGGERGISPPAGGKVASRPSRAARRQHVSRRPGASAGQTGARGVSAGGAGAGGSEARCHVRGRRGRGLDHAISKRPATQGGGGGWTTQRSLRPSREKTSRTTRATFSKRGRGSPSAPVSAGGRSFEEGFNAVLAGRAGHGAEGGGGGTFCTTAGFQKPRGRRLGAPVRLVIGRGAFRLTQEGSLGKQGTAGRPVLTVADYTVPAG